MDTQSIAAEVLSKIETHLSHKKDAWVIYTNITVIPYNKYLLYKSTTVTLMLNIPT
jgi:hypothetical protein